MKSRKKKNKSNLDIFPFSFIYIKLYINFLSLAFTKQIKITAFGLTYFTIGDNRKIEQTTQYQKKP